MAGGKLCRRQDVLGSIAEEICSHAQRPLLETRILAVALDEEIGSAAAEVEAWPAIRLGEPEEATI